MRILRIESKSNIGIERAFFLYFSFSLSFFLVCLLNELLPAIIVELLLFLRKKRIKKKMNCHISFRLNFEDLRMNFCELRRRWQVFFFFCSIVEIICLCKEPQQSTFLWKELNSFLFILLFLSFFLFLLLYTMSLDSFHFNPPSVIHVL